MSYIVVLPTVEADQAHDCLATMPEVVRRRTWIVWNTRNRQARGPFDEIGGYWNPPNNIGVAASWNLGIDKAERLNARYLVLCSTGVRFGASAIDWFEQLEALDPSWAFQSQLGWRLIAIERETWRKVGRFDENFWPAYYEDTDYLYRMGLAGLPSPRENGQPLPWAAVDATAIESHALMHGVVSIDLGALEWHYRQKWGGKQGEERYDTPFASGRDWTWCPTGKELTDMLMREGDCNAP